MNIPLAIASNEADAAAAAAVEQHHAEMAGALHLKVQDVLAAAARGDGEAVASPAERLAAVGELVARFHATADRTASRRTA